MQSTFAVQQINNLPKLPEPTGPLKAFLCKYESDLKEHLTLPYRPKRTQRNGLKPKARRINGFMAFRTFYSKAIKLTSSQPEVSSELATIWKNEKCQKIWHCYALRYNATGGDQSFLIWLNRSLGLTPAQKDSKVLRTSRSNIYSNVEDVFWEDRSTP